jgi:hypothetical protein
VSVQRRAFGDVADLTPVLDLIRAMPTASRHVLDFGWRLTAPAIAAGRDAVYWQGAGVEFRDDDQDRQALVAAHGFVHNASAPSARRGASVAVVETELDLTAARAAYEAAGFGQIHTIWRQDAWATDVT